MNIRESTKQDYKVCQEIADFFSESTPTQDIFDNLVQNKEIFVIEKSGMIIGFISYKILWNTTACLQFLRIHPNFHKQGIATKLITYLEGVLQQRGMEEVMSTLFPDNIASKMLHEKLGYQHVGEIGFSSGTELVYFKGL